jgi:hypothetical protein
MLGYLAGPQVGAIVYNLIHHRGLAAIYYMAGVLLAIPILSFVGVIVFAHSSLDRVLGYGLKFPDSFAHTLGTDWAGPPRIVCRHRFSAERGNPL